MDIQWIIDNWGKIPDSFKTDLKSGYSGERSPIPSVPLDEHVVVLLLDRQKPSVQQDYSFDEERIGVTRTGKIIWGFDSGCSCPSPWHDSYPECYSCSGTWKEFSVNLKDFDVEVIEACEKAMKELKKSV